MHLIRSLRFLTGDDDPPFDYAGQNGVLEGFNVDIARAVCTELAIPCTVQARRWDMIVAALEAGEGDVIAASLAPTQEARARLLFTEPYYRTPARFVGRQASPVSNPTPKAVAGLRIATAASTAHRAYLSAFFPRSVIAAMPTLATAEQALKDGKADLAFGDGTALAFWLNGTESAGCCRFIGGPYLENRFFGEGIGMAVRPADSAVKQAIDYALYQLWERGIYADLYRRWFPVSPYGVGP